MAEAAPTTKTVQLSKVLINPDISAENQHVKVGTICLFAGPALNFGSGERTLNYERFERLFTATIKEQGYNAVAKSSDLFEGQGTSPKPDFLIGATFRPTYVKICDSIDGQKGSILAEVSWQIFDVSKQQVVESAKTEGRGDLAKFKQDGLNFMYDQSFINSIKDLIATGFFDKYLGKPASK
ncbi:MAG: hypothetical protein ACO1NM_03165 [Sphingobium phenoxybenzoativorans]